MKIKSITRKKLNEHKAFYDITVEKYHNFSIGNSKIICHNSSLSGAIAKLARPFGCSHQILEGDGFFGSPVNPAPSAARYTSVRINPLIKSLVNRHMDLNEKNEEGGIDHLNIEVPIGLLTHAIGIAVGYRSNILPRKMEDIIEYLDGKNKVMKPYFKDFSGKIFKFGEGEKTWLIESGYEVDLQKKIIRIFDLPPVMRYDSFIDKLNQKLDFLGYNYKMKNGSQSKCDLTISFNQVTNTEMGEISKTIKKITQIVIREDIVFVRNGAVSEFFSIKEYLDSFKFHLEEVRLNRILKDEEDFKNELSFLEAKLKFLIFMSQKKRISKEIENFLAQFTQKISLRLSLIQIVKLSDDHIKETQTEITRAKENIKKTQTLAKLQKKKISDLQKVKIKPKSKSLIPITIENIPLQIDGIEVFNIEDNDDQEVEHSDEFEV